MYPNLKEEKRLWKQGYKLIAGLDESGRGPLAGPVVAAAVYVSKNFKIKNVKLRDSKKLSEKKREFFYETLTNHPHIGWGIGIVSEILIDKMNILEATKLAMLKAVNNLKVDPDFLILDGNFKIHPVKYRGAVISPMSKLFNGVNSNIQQKSIIRADETIFSCVAAGIIAKVERDRIMQKLHKKYPQYGFNAHKGYGTDLHIKNLKTFGLCKIHRKSFEPVRATEYIRTNSRNEKMR